MCHIIHPFKVYNSLVSIYAQKCTTIDTVEVRIISWSQGRGEYLKQCTKKANEKVKDWFILKLIFPGGSVVKNPFANAGDTGSIPGSGRSPGKGNGNPF